jgi:hypothetical protein
MLPGGSPEKFFARGNETLYEAYNQLHTLAQEFDKPFDAPAILVVGQQTDGKSGTRSELIINPQRRTLSLLSLSLSVSSVLLTYKIK